jgi:hypothetical protein
VSWLMNRVAIRSINLPIVGEEEVPLKTQPSTSFISTTKQIWEAGEGQFDGDVPEDAKHQEDHGRGPQHYEYSSQELESKPYPMALNLHTIVYKQHISGE